MSIRDKPYAAVAQFAALALHAAELQNAAKEAPSQANDAAATQALRALVRSGERICRLFRLDAAEDLSFCFVLLSAGASAYCLYLYLSQLEAEHVQSRAAGRHLVRT
jgi:hypothetical protein